MKKIMKNGKKEMVFGERLVIQQHIAELGLLAIKGVVNSNEQHDMDKIIKIQYVANITQTLMNGVD